MKKILLVALIVVGAGAAGWYFWTRATQTDPNVLILHGNVDIRQVSLAFEGSGRIKQMLAEEGDVVKAGQTIAVLDTRTLELQVLEQVANVEVQRQMVLKLNNGARPEEIAQARAQLASTEADAVLADQEYARATRLQSSANGAISQQSVDQVRAASQAAKAKVSEQRAALQLVEVGTRAEELLAAQAQLDAAEASLALLKHQVEQGELLAPTDAVVRSRLREPGDMVTSTSPVVSLALMQPKWIRAYVGEPDLGKLKPGTSVEVLTDSHPDKPIVGKVGYMSSVAEFTPKAVQTEELRPSLMYEVRVVVEDADDVLRLGQPATVRVAIEPKP